MNMVRVIELILIFARHQLLSYQYRILDLRLDLLFLPKGLAHGFLSLEDDTILNYKCDNYYEPKSESGFNLFKSKLNVDLKFNKEDLILSDKDKKLNDFDKTYIFKDL